jgi:hypothetical protein
MLTGTFLQGIHYQDGHISAFIVQVQNMNTIKYTTLFCTPIESAVASK